MPDLLASVEDFKPTILIGACGQAAMFTQSVLGAMSRLNDRPIAVALSNPTSKAQCTAEQVYTWTDGRAIFASGSPFDPVTVAGRTHTPGQVNNSFVFAGVGLELLLSGGWRTRCSLRPPAPSPIGCPCSIFSKGACFPLRRRMREVALAVAVAAVAHEQGHATHPWPADLAAEAARFMYVPQYAWVLPRRTCR